VTAPSLPLPVAPAAASPGGRALRAAPALVGGALAIAGALLPWLTFFLGVKTLPGIRGLYGWLVLSAGIAALMFGVAHLHDGDRRHLRHAGVLGLGLLAFMAWVVPNVLATVARLARNPMLLAGAGPGAFVALGAGVVMALSLWVAGGRGTRD
jgi:hypothetical protein